MLQERIQERIVVEKDIPVPHMMEKTIEVVKLSPQGHVQNRTVEQIIDMPVVVQETVETPQIQLIVQKVQKTAEVPQAQSTDNVMNALWSCRGKFQQFKLHRKPSRIHRPSPLYRS